MEDGEETQAKNDAPLTTPMAIRRAKASLLLSSLSPIRRRENHTMDEKAMEKMRKDVRDLKVRVARERLKNRRIKSWGSFELLVHLALLFSMFLLLLVLIFSGS